MEMFEVGGCVRDEIRGVVSNDIDFSVVLSEREASLGEVSGETPFEVMEILLTRLGFELIEQARKPEHLTARGFFPKNHSIYPGKAADFVLARKEGAYSDGRRPDKVEVGTLIDDLSRRDFRFNAIAKSLDGDIIDPFNGVQDINEGVIRAVGAAADRLNEDALRAIRALRFSVTTGFRIDHELKFAMEMASVLDKVAGKAVSEDRIRAELNKMLAANSLEAVMAMNRFPQLTAAMLSGSISLEATMKKRKGSK